MYLDVKIDFESLDVKIGWQLSYNWLVATDHVDAIVAQWRKERPDLDPSPMAVIGRISRLERIISSRLAAVFSRHDLESWEFDVLATLRRSGEPHRLTVGALLESMMITSGTMTNRIDRLEHRRLVKRVPDASDRRVVLVELTSSGRELVNRVLPDHLANEAAMLESLSDTDVRQLTRVLRKLSLDLGGDST